jgi:hypothetical protein
MRTRTSLTVAALACAFVYATAQAFVTIDNFTDVDVNPQIVGPISAGSATDTDTGLTGAIGGQRKLNLTINGSTFGQTSDLRVDTTPTFGVAIFNNASGNDSTGIITWDGGGTLGGVDLTEAGVNDRINVAVLFADLNLALTVDLTDGGGDVATVAKLTGAMAGLEGFRFNDFLANNALIDLTDINKVELTFDGPAAQDATIRFIEATIGIPEPAAVSLLTIGLAGLMRRRRA